MKKAIILILFIVPVTLYAQRFKGGILLGMNVSQIDGDHWAGYNKAGIVGGAFVYTDFTDRWTANMEIRYAEKGSSTSKDDPIQSKYRLQYVEIPLTVKYTMYKKLRVEAGVSFGYLFTAAEKDASGYVTFEMPDRTELAACGGVIYNFFERLDVGARVSYSMFPIWGEPLDAYGTGAWFNNVITFAAYYRIGKV